LNSKRRFLQRLGDSEVPLSRLITAEIRNDYGRVTLTHNDTLQATIEKDGSYWLLFYSDRLIDFYMKKDEALTASILEHWRNYKRRVNPKHEEQMLTYLEHWINEHPFKSFGKPDVYPAGRKGWQTGEFESGNTESFGDDCWIGDTFIFAHFYMEPRGQGAIILWHKGGDIRGNYAEPEVWVGDFDAFMNEQSNCGWFEESGFISYNEVFEGGFMWALREMGGFREFNDVNVKVYRAIIEEPKIAIEPIDIGVLKNPQAFPIEVVSAVQKYAEKH